MSRDTIENPSAAARYRAAVWTATIAAAFSLVVCVVLAFNVRRVLADDPMDSPQLLELHAELQKSPADGGLRRRYRDLDRRLREEFFRQQRLVRNGAYLLVGGLVVFLAAGQYALTFRAKLPHPGPAGEQTSHEPRGRLLGRCGVAGFGVLLASAAALSWVLGSPGAAPPGPAVVASDTAAGTPSTAVVVRIPSEQEIRRNWPRFRGPGGLGVSAFTNVPSQWSPKTGRNILWKTAVPLPGQNSPIVWGDRVFLTGATRAKREVYCFNAAGKLLWRREIRTAKGAALPPPNVWEDGYAPSTAATDGQRVYAIFANGDLACLDYSGTVVWSECLGPLFNSYGHASSLATYRGLLLVQLDQNTPGETPTSKLLACDVGSGKRVWAADREIDGSWMSPIVIRTESGAQIIAGGNPYLIAHDPDDGDEIWRAEVQGSDPAPSPIFAGGLVFVAQPYGDLTAIRPDGVGDVTKSKVAWTADLGVPDIPSPLGDGKLLWTVDTMGMLTCFDAADGNIVYEQDLDMGFLASPSLVGERVYLLSDEGVMLIIEAGREYKLISRAEIGEPAMASPAFLDGRIYIRGKKHLFCIGEKK